MLPWFNDNTKCMYFIDNYIVRVWKGGREG